MDAIDQILAKHAPSVDDVLARYAPPPPEDDAPGESPEETFLIPGHKRQPQRPIRNTGPIEQVRAGLDPRNAEGHGTFDQAAGAVNSMADRYSMGLFGGALRLARGLNETGIGRTVNAQLAPEVNEGQGSADAALRSIDEYRSRHPLMSIATDAPAFAVSGPVTATAASVDRLLPAATSALGRLGRTALTSAGTSGVIAGTEAASRGEGIEEGARDAGRGALTGLAAGTALGVGGGLLGGAARAVMGSRGAQAREFIERRGGTVGPTTSGRGGPMRGMPEHPTDSDIGAAATASADNVKSMLREYEDRVAGQPYREAIGQVSPGAAAMELDITPIYKSLVKAANDPANIAQADRLNGLVKMFESKRIPLPHGGGDRFIADEQWVNGLRRGLGTISGVGETTAGRLAPLQRAFHEVKAVVDEGPFAEANRVYHRGMSDVDESLDMAGLRRSHAADEPYAGNLRVKAQRLGQNTVTAGAERDQMAAFREKHPDMALELDRPELLRAKADLGFRTFGPHHGGFIQRHGGDAAAVLGAYEIGQQLLGGHGLHALASIPLALAVKNASPIAGRFLYGPAQEALMLEPQLLQRTDLLQAARNAREERR